MLWRGKVVHTVHQLWTWRRCPAWFNWLRFARFAFRIPTSSDVVARCRDLINFDGDAVLSVPRPIDPVVVPLLISPGCGRAWLEYLIIRQPTLLGLPRSFKPSLWRIFTQIRDYFRQLGDVSTVFERITVICIPLLVSFLCWQIDLLSYYIFLLYKTS